MKHKYTSRLFYAGLLFSCSFLLSIALALATGSCIQAKAAEDVRLNVSEVSIVKDDTFRLRAYNVPKNAKIIYRSSDTSVAFVDSRGYITGISNGECIVTATVVIGGSPSETLKCDVTVGPAAISIKFTKSEIVLGVGMKKTLKTIISPLNTVEKPIFYSANKLVASITSIGRVRAKGVGETIIFAFLLNGESAECQIYVLDENDYARYNETGTLVGIIEGYAESDDDNGIEEPEIKDGSVSGEDIEENAETVGNAKEGISKQASDSTK